MWLRIWELNLRGLNHWGDIFSSQYHSACDCCNRRVSPHTLVSWASWFIQRLCSNYDLSLLTAHCNFLHFFFLLENQNEHKRRWRDAHFNWNRFNKDNLSAPGTLMHYFLHKSWCIITVSLCCSCLYTKVSFNLLEVRAPTLPCSFPCWNSWMLLWFPHLRIKEMLMLYVVISPYGTFPPLVCTCISQENHSEWWMEPENKDVAAGTEAGWAAAAMGTFFMYQLAV